MILLYIQVPLNASIHREKKCAKKIILLNNLVCSVKGRLQALQHLFRKGKQFLLKDIFYDQKTGLIFTDVGEAQGGQNSLNFYYFCTETEEVKSSVFGGYCCIRNVQQDIIPYELVSFPNLKIRFCCADVDFQRVLFSIVQSICTYRLCDYSIY